jgi:hypothetical protein
LAAAVRVNEFPPALATRGFCEKLAVTPLGRPDIDIFAEKSFVAPRRLIESDTELPCTSVKLGFSSDTWMPP